MNNDKIYYFSNNDNQLHNANDIKYKNIKDNIIEILDVDKYIIDSAVLYSLNEIISSIKKAVK